MQQISWNQFGLKAESKQRSFEDLCMYLCCRELKITKIEAYHNQPGIETEPFEVNGKKYGFQVKFFESKFDWQQIKHSIVGKEDKKTHSTTLNDKYPNNVFEQYGLDKLFIYTNKEKTSGKGKEKAKAETLIADLAKEYDAKVEYITETEIKLKLSQPSNFDLAQLYFDVGDEFNFIKSSTNPKVLTFLKSSEYLSLPLTDNQDKKIKSFSAEVLEAASNIFLLLGNPGSGKSILMHKLLRKLGGLNEKSKEDAIKTLTQNGAVPTLINLKNCVTDSLENILRGRKNDNKLDTNQKLSFIYLFDGLDELDEATADSTLFKIYELSQQKDTKKIIISCRSGNANRLLLKRYFNDAVEYKINNLDDSFIDKFFDAKSQQEKKALLGNLKQNNQELTKAIDDVILIKLLWDTIESLDKDSTVIDLFAKKIDLLLESPLHQGNITNLNLLNPKKQAIIELNKDIAYRFQQKFQFRFPQKDLQTLILEKFPRLDYASVNTILHYIADLFFEGTYSKTQPSQATYIYQHRRYQEYFYTLRLKLVYEKNPQILRTSKALANKEYFYKLFLPYLKSEYKKENNLAGMLELNLIELYSGRHSGFGADEPYYLESEQFIPSLVHQEKYIFNELFEDENLSIKEVISIDIDEVKKQIEQWKKEKGSHNSSSKHYLKNVWESKVATLITNIPLFWKAGYQDIAKTLKSQLDDVRELLDDCGFLKEVKPKKPYWVKCQDYVYCRLIIENNAVDDLLFNWIRKLYDNFSDSDPFELEEHGKEKLVKSFFRICLKEKKEELFDLLPQFADYEFVAFLDILRAVEYLPIFVNATSIHHHVKQFVQGYSQELNDKNYHILFYKHFFNISLDQKDLKILRKYQTELTKRKGHNQIIYKTYRKAPLISYALSQDNFDTLAYYNETGIHNALFNEFIQLLNNEKTITEIVRDYLLHIKAHKPNRKPELYLKDEISFLWAYIFSNSQSDIQLLIRLCKMLIQEEDNNITPYEFYLTLIKINPSLYHKLIDETLLQPFEEEVKFWEDEFRILIDKYFTISWFYSRIDSNKAKNHFNKGIVEGILRHGWRKDTIVSSSLMSAFEIVWKNNWITTKEKAEYARQIFKLALQITQITDGKFTEEAPYQLIKIIADGEIDLAEELKETLKTERKYRNILASAITSILINKVKNGHPLEDIKKGMEEYTTFDESYIVYLILAENDLYTNEEKQTAFNKAYDIIELQKQEVSNRDDSVYKMIGLNKQFYFSDSKLYQVFRRLCQVYNKPFILNDDSSETKEEKPKITEKGFTSQVANCKTKRQLLGKYKKLQNYDNRIVLKKQESWEVLIDKTLQLCENSITPFFDYLRGSGYPHLSFISHNGDHLHLGLAVLLKNTNTKQITLDYLYKNGGHEGFVNTMKAYEVLEDKKMCLSLFERFLRFCEFLVY